MSYNGSGTFQINSTGQPVVGGTIISSATFNALTADLATGLTTAITKDGQTTTTARIPFALGINSTLVTDASSTTTGSIITAGGVGIAKKLYVGTDANITGTVTAGTVTATLTNSTVDGTDAVGFRNIPISSKSAAYTTVLADSGKVIFHPSTDANARTFTIDSNANVAYALGTAITFINMTSQVVTIAITTDTMYLSSAGTTGSRSLAQYGSATAIKMTSTTWLISGSGLS